MCRFCVEHGEGERWYLNARNYAFDLEHDVRRSTYIEEFIEGFGEMRASALKWAKRADGLPIPLSRAGKALVSWRMRPKHFGQPVPIEECSRILDIATSITLIPCICRMHTPGKKPDEVCILVTTQPIEALLTKGFSSYQDGPDASDFHRITKQQAMELLADCERKGLMHSVWTFITPFTAAICNCDLESGCMAMRMTVGHGVKLMWRGEWVARLDTASCRRCGACARRCPFKAIHASDGRMELRVTDCWGCGVCRSACAYGAIELVDRSVVPEVANRW